MGLKACKRELLGLDGAFMKGTFPGQVFAVVGLDLNNRIYPLSYALVEAESRVKSDLLINNIYEVFNGKIAGVGQDGSGGSGVGAVRGLYVTDCAGVGVGSKDRRELGDGMPTLSSAAGDASEWSFMSFKKISPLAEEIIVMIRKRLQKTKASSYKAKLMHLEDGMGWYTDEIWEQAEKIADDLRDIAYYIVKQVVKKYTYDV
nr:transposase, MuDR, MULE transposase domain protein [Tanacetum cinerariifolium]